MLEPRSRERERERERESSHTCVGGVVSYTDLMMILARQRPTMDAPAARTAASRDVPLPARPRARAAAGRGTASCVACDRRHDDGAASPDRLLRPPGGTRDTDSAHTVSPHADQIRFRTPQRPGSITDRQSRRAATMLLPVTRHVGTDRCSNDSIPYLAFRSSAHGGPLSVSRRPRVGSGWSPYEFLYTPSLFGR